MSLLQAVGPYTWDDFIALEDHDRRELVDGELVEVEVPKRRHERIVVALVTHLHSWAKKHGGEVLGSGYKVRIGDRRGVMPDVQYYRSGNEPAEDEEDGLFRGRPDLVVEVLSPKSRRYDRFVKREYYGSRKVPEYWLIDPENEIVERLLYSKTGYLIAEAMSGDLTFAPSTFPGLRVPLVELWAPRVSPAAPSANYGAPKALAKAKR